MIDKVIQKECTGCKMCADICPQSAIIFPQNSAFWYPRVDYSLCIKCGLCTNHCPSLTTLETKTPTDKIRCYGVWHKNNRIRFNSTSGGFFTALANYVIEELCGCCIGAIYDEDNIVKHDIIDNKEEIIRLSQSKYVQSETNGIYKQTQDLLKQGKTILFCGSACQISALYSFLKKDYNNLITMDFICLGIPSPLVYKKYLSYLENRYKSKVTKVWFKYKINGWRAISTRIDFNNGKSYIKRGNEDPYMISFVIDFLNIRPSCDLCKYRHFPHKSDFTVGDFWGVEKIFPKDDDNKGISAVFVNTSQGNDIFELIKHKFNVRETTIHDICVGNFTTYKSAIPSSKRELFLKEIESKTFHEVMKKYGSYSQSYFIRFKQVLMRLKLFVNKLR